MEPTGDHGVRGVVLPEGLADAVRGTASDIAALLRAAPDPRAPVPGLEWTVGELAAHLAQANALMADVAAGRARPYGDGTPRGIAAANAQALAAFGERAAEPLAAMIVEQADACLAAVQAGDADETLTTPMGPMNRAVLAAYLLTHLLGHGYDLARARRRPHMVDRTRAALTLPFMIEAMPRVTDPAAVGGLDARYAVRLWGGGQFGVTFTDGTVTVSPALPDRPDCTLSVEPVTFLLMALGRRSPVGAMARGRVVARGRRPWLGPRFPGYFTAP
ncbi:maleylpyruvate isomerase family mycothiol-dependent enzyme [Streptomyces sp. NPDC002530]